ncbi:hypothetical protein QAD02_022342 [Eretmocerus hayati]|uniref:Uncharacterized protein n=1 Tax=Eretmocerus hayati TaxID=131215 RepID=A0ACC2PUA7_9HYME|nr:hypothetical protein QAD02_022342 [Eretmocerus hayati]
MVTLLIEFYSAGVAIASGVMDFRNPRALITLLIFIWWNHIECNAETPISYKGAQVWRLNGVEENLEYIHYLEEEGDVSIWKVDKSLLDIVMDWTSYHRLDDMYGYLDYVARTYPNCSIRTIGKSHEGRALKVLHIGAEDQNVPAIWIDGGIHAREWISPAVVTYIIDYLVKYGNKFKVQYYIMPMVNPDGYEYTFQVDRLWRKNRRRPKRGQSCHGVDLNRNFGYKWGISGTSNHTCSQIYGGSAPFSEPESRAMRDFFNNEAADFKAYLTFHSFGQLIVYPWGYGARVPPDYVDLDTLGRVMASKMKQAGEGTTYKVGNTARLLSSAAGGSDDWAKAHLDVKYSYTIELPGYGENGFALPDHYIGPTGREGVAAVEVVAEAVQNLE